MANTYSQIHLQIVFAVKYRRALITESFREEVEKFITSVIQSRRHKLLAIYCMPDHAHIFMGYRPREAISDLVRDIKAISSQYIRNENLTAVPFSWQHGYGVFSYRKSDVPQIVNYVLKQPQHHRRKTFREEYLELLEEFEVDFDDRYLFDFFDK